MIYNGGTGGLVVATNLTTITVFFLAVVRLAHPARHLIYKNRQPALLVSDHQKALQLVLTAVFSSTAAPGPYQRISGRRFVKSQRAGRQLGQLGTVRRAPMVIDNYRPLGQKQGELGR